jgi:hypothetical protein
MADPAAPDPMEAREFLARIQNLAAAAEEKKRVSKLAALTVKAAAQVIIESWAADGATSETIEELEQHIQQNERVKSLALSRDHVSEALERFLDEFMAAGATVSGSGKERYVYWGYARPRK